MGVAVSDFLRVGKICNPTNFVCNRLDEVYQVSELLDVEIHTGLWLATRVSSITINRTFIAICPDFIGPVI